MTMTSKTETSSNLSGMSVDKLKDLLYQMKELIELNEPQARQILVQNPVLTKALFEAQVMLGMFSLPQSQPMQANGLPHLPQSNPQPSVPAFTHQQHSQMGGIPHSGAPQMHHHLQLSSVMSPPSQQAPLPSQSTYQIDNSSVVGEFDIQMGGGGALLSAAPEPISAPIIISEMEKAFIEQIMKIKEEDLNKLPPYQREQLFQLQQILFRSL